MLPRDLVNIFPSFLSPNLTNVGFGVFLAANATIVMGGVFPFLSIELQSSANMAFYYLVQSLSFGFTLLVSALLIFNHPSTRRYFFPIAFIVYFVGCCCTIAMSYFPGLFIEVLLFAGFFLGVGSALFHASWQIILAVQDNGQGNRNLIVGTMFSAIIYFALFLLPIAVTQLLVAFVFLPLFTLCFVLERRKVDLTLPMLTDTPLQHVKVYKKAIKDYWRSVICIGSIGLASGVVRSIAITEPSIGIKVNSAALLGSLIAASVLLFLWSRRTLTISVGGIFRVFFPFLIIGFVLLPFFGNTYSNIFSSLLFMAYSFANILMLMQCAQSSRDRGLNPVIIYGSFGGLVTMMQDAGFVSGYSAEMLESVGLEPFWPVALIAVALLSLSYFVGSGGFSGTLSTFRAKADHIELIECSANALQQEHTAKATLPLEEQYDFLDCKTEPLVDQESAAKQASRDITSLKCTELQEHYCLTNRETEVMEYLARGWSMKDIAEELFISENTVRTHAKRIYTKLAIHKRQELRDLLELF